MQEDNTRSNDKKPSAELLSLIKAAAKSLDAFGSLWDSIKKKGADEGFDEPMLQEMLRPLLQEQMGMTKDRVYYLFHKEEVKEKQRTRDQDHRKIAKIVQEKEPVKSITDEKAEAIADKYASIPLPPSETEGFTERDIDINTVSFKMNSRDGRGYLKDQLADMGERIGKKMPALANRGWRWLNVEVTVKVLPR